MSSPSRRCSPVVVASSAPAGRCPARAGGGDQITAHVAERIRGLTHQPVERHVQLVGSHAGPGAHLDSDRGQVGNRPVVGAVGIARRQSHFRTGRDQRGQDADRVGQDVLPAGHGAPRQFLGCHLDSKRRGDRRRPSDPLQFCLVHGPSTPGVGFASYVWKDDYSRSRCGYRGRVARVLRSTDTSWAISIGAGGAASVHRATAPPATTSSRSQAARRFPWRGASRPAVGRDRFLHEAGARPPGTSTLTS